MHVAAELPGRPSSPRPSESACLGYWLLQSSIVLVNGSESSLGPKKELTCYSFARWPRAEGDAAAASLFAHATAVWRSSSQT